MPTRGELYYLMGNKKAGKSWWLQHLCRRGARQSWNCVHITLENKPKLVKQRYVQSWLSVAKRNEPYVLSDFLRDKQGVLDDINYEVRTPRMSFDNPKDRTEIERQTRRWRRSMDRILIKEWPSGV